MSMVIRKPQSPILAQYVEFFWHLKSEGADDNDSVLVFPETRFEIILNYADPTIWQGASEQVPLKRSYLSGIRRNFFHINPQGETEILAVRFFPLAFYRLLKFPLSELNNQLWDIENVLDPALHSIFQGVMSIELLDERLAYLENSLLSYLQSGAAADHDLSGLLSHIDHREGTGRIEELSSISHFSRRSLERQFNKYLGVNPKYYSRVVRFNSLFEQLNLQKPENISALVQQYGFADQAHLIREFKFFTGKTPGQISEISD